MQKLGCDSVLVTMLVRNFLPIHKTRVVNIGVLVVLVIALSLGVFLHQKQQHAATNLPFPFIASVDTMKESMDTVNNQLTDVQIADDVNLAATLNTTHITVDTFYDYPGYMQRWVNAIRKTGKHVWFRPHFNAWQGQNGAAATMTPTQYENAEQSFILAHASLFQSGDIFDPCPEPEESPYWVRTWGASWSWQNAPNAGTDEYNTFILATTTIADTAFHHVGISGVVTTIHSMTAYFWERPTALYDTTVKQLGVVAVDTYPDNTTTDPTTAAKARTDELAVIESVRQVPIVNAELGYNTASTSIVDDSTQNTVLKAELQAISQLNYVVGMNYWVGAGSSKIDGTRLFNGSSGHWILRPAAYTVAAYYATQVMLTSITPAPNFPNQQSSAIAVTRKIEPTVPRTTGRSMP